MPKQVPNEHFAKEAENIQKQIDEKNDGNWFKLYCL